MRCLLSHDIPVAHKWHILSNRGTRGLAHEPSSALGELWLAVQDWGTPLKQAAEIRKTSKERASLSKRPCRPSDICAALPLLSRASSYGEHLDHPILSWLDIVSMESHCRAKCCHRATIVLIQYWYPYRRHQSKCWAHTKLHEYFCNLTMDRAQLRHGEPLQLYNNPVQQICIGCLQACQPACQPS